MSSLYRLSHQHVWWGEHQRFTSVNVHIVRGNSCRIDWNSSSTNLEEDIRRSCLCLEVQKYSYCWSDSKSCEHDSVKWRLIEDAWGHVSWELNELYFIMLVLSDCLIKGMMEIRLVQYIIKLLNFWFQNCVQSVTRIISRVWAEQSCKLDCDWNVYRVAAVFHMILVDCWGPILQRYLGHITSWWVFESRHISWGVQLDKQLVLPPEVIGKRRIVIGLTLLLSIPRPLVCAN